MSFRRNAELAEIVRRLRQHSHPEDEFWREHCPDCADLARQLFENQTVRDAIRRGRDQIARGESVRLSDLRKEFRRS